jgi:argininosuccinate synthase
VAVNGQKLSPAKLVEELNQIGGRNGCGRIDIVENRFVGMKSRGVYEAPGMTLLYAAHQGLEQMTLDRDLTHLRDSLSPQVAEMVYYGFWYCAKMDALMAFIRETQKPVTGEVKLTLYKGNVRVSSRTSPTACTKPTSPAWNAVVRTTRPTRKVSFASWVCPYEFRVLFALANIDRTASNPACSRKNKYQDQTRQSEVLPCFFCCGAVGP